MENSRKKKISDFMWWVILVVIIAWAIMTWPMFTFGLALIGAILFYCYHSPPESADTNERAEIVEEKESDFAAGEEKIADPPHKFDSFYSGISAGSSIDGGAE